MTDRVGWRILTARGARLFDGSEGHVLAHEHVLIDNRVWWEGDGPAHALDPGGPQQFSSELEAIRKHPDGTLRENLVLADWYLAAIELYEAVQAGCALIVDLTTDGLGPEPELAATAADLAKVPLVLGIGRYVEAALTASERTLDGAQLLDAWRERLARGQQGQGPSYGVIGEIGVGPRPSQVELTSVSSAALLSAESGLGLAIHAPLEPWDYRAFAVDLERRGVIPARTVLCHRDAVLDPVELAFWSAEGFLLGFDLFGTGPHRSVAGHPFPSDPERLHAIAALVEAGHEHQLVLSHDVCTRDQLLRFGGVGYAHLGRSVLPSLTKLIGTQAVQQVSALNALRWLHVPEAQ